MSPRVLLPALALSVLLPACTVRGGGGGGGGDDDDDDAADDDDTPTPESDCGDELDNDDDGLIDCEDEDCLASEPSCSWPSALSHATLILFDGFSVDDCFWGTSTFQVPDCSTDVTAPLTVLESGDVCAECDLTFTGPFTYNQDDCSELLDQAPPTDALFGFVFTSATSWQLWGKNEQGVWAETGELTDDGTGTFRSTRVETVREEIDDIGCPEADIGSLSISVSFTPTE